jgi:alkylated DNA repair dioxygenase AlkB
MSRVRVALLCATALLAGCLEVEQHPPWRHGQYDGKKDNLPQQRNFHGDRLAWTATVQNRNWLQDEYPRTLHKGANRD